MKSLLISIFLLGGAMLISCQEDVDDSSLEAGLENEIFIWENTKFENPLSDLEEIITERPPQGICPENRSIEKVANPSLTPYLLPNTNGMAVIICPGGGYAQLAFDKEGTIIAELMNKLNISAFVLKYRLPEADNSENIPLQDAQRAIRYVKSHAEEFGIDPQKVGIMGFSAGGHLAATLSTSFEKEVYPARDSIDVESARPAFSMLIYPVISMEEEITHQGSRNRLLGENPSPELVADFSLENRVNELTPPAFLAHAKDDESVIPENSIRYNDALIKARINSALHLYENGGHGGSICLDSGEDFRRWVLDCKNWLETLDL